MREPTTDDVCIVGYGAVLPDAATPEGFWHNLVAGRSAIRNLPDQRWLRDLYVGAEPGDEQSVASTAACIDDELLDELCREHRLHRSRHNRLQIITLAACRQAIAGIRPEVSAQAQKAIFLGCMSADEALGTGSFQIENSESLAAHLNQHCSESAEQMLEAIDAHCRRWRRSAEELRGDRLSTSVLDLVRDRCRWSGVGALIDAACASSMAAVDVAVRALRSGQADLVMTGGIESNLGPDTFVLFSALGALAADRCLPFDARSGGLCQGEGAVIFVLQRLADATRSGHPIHAVIRGIGASSDGRSSSLFEPTADGQQRAYEQAYHNLDPDRICYLECHGTGTRLGDSTELASVHAFFGDRRLPIGSVKANVGHTKGAAGAASMLKCLLAMKHRTVPPSPYCDSPLADSSAGAFVNTEPLPLPEKRKPLLMGVSSFGFGGINYHAVLEQWPGVASPAVTPPQPARPVVLVAEEYRGLKGLDPGSSELADLSIPPRSLQQIDQVQLAALLVARKALAQLPLSLPLNANRSRLSVVAASCIGLDASLALCHRVRHQELVLALGDFDQKLRRIAINHRAMYPKVTEDSGPGVLNNVIAGRVANHLDLHGPSYNVDGDLASTPLALELSRQALSERDGLVIVLAVDEAFDQEKLERRGVRCFLLASLDYAHEQNLPICSVLEPLAVPAAQSTESVA